MEGLDKSKRKDKLHTSKFTNDHKSHRTQSLGGHRKDTTYKAKIQAGEE